MKKLIWLAIGVIVISTAMSAELQSFYKSKFSGLNNSVNIRLLQDDEASDMSNFSLDEIGSIKERDLFGQYNSSSGILGLNSITGLFKHYTSTSKYFFACAGTKIGLGSGGTFTDVSPSNSTVISSSFYNGVSFNNKFYLYNPKDEPYVYIGSGSFHKLGNASAIPSSNCAFSAIHKSRVWAARSDTYPYRLYFSSLNNAEDWVTTGGYVDLPDINQEIKGIVSWGGYLYIFTETNIYVLLGSTPNDFSLRKTNSMVGAIASRSIVITDIGIGFLARSGYYAFDGNNSNKLSVKIESTINNISKTLIQNACAIYDGRKIWLSYTVTGSSYNNDIILYDTLLKEWCQYKGSACNINYFARAFGGTDKGELYGGSSTNNGYIYQLQSATGTESISHSTETDFLNGVTFNTVIGPTPTVELPNGQDTYTKFLSHFDGTDGATTYTAETGQVITFVVNSKLSTSAKKFGNTSLYVDGASYVTVPDNANWDYTTNPFTIDTWIYLNSVAGDQTIYGQVEAGATTPRIVFTYHAGTSTLEFFVYDGGTNIQFNCPFSPSAGQWYHIALVRVNTDNAATAWRIFVNGVSQTLTLAGGAWNGAFPAAVNGPVTFGVALTNAGGTPEQYLNGYIDEPRISKGIARWTSDFTVSTAPYGISSTNGTLTSSNFQINAAGQSTLDKISWVENLATNTKITFQTRTGVTDDTVYFNGWQYWSSDNSVTLNTVTDATVTFISSNNNDLKIQKPSSAQTKNILYYEDEDNVSPSSAQFQVFGAISTNDYAEAFIPVTNLTNYEWLGGWYKSPATGNSVEFYMGNGVVSDNYVTFNTVQANTWEKWYWYIGGISSKDHINYIKYRYKGDVAGNLIMGGISGYNFYTTEDTISSTPNDYIQYRAILGSNSTNTPKLLSVLLTYTPQSGTPESSLSSYYYTKWFDFKTPQVNKQFDSLILEANSTTSSSCTLYCDYDIDFGLKTGTFSFPITTTANTVRLYKNFPSSIYGKSMRLKIYNNDKDAQVTIKGAEIRYRQEPVTPD